MRETANRMFSVERTVQQADIADLYRSKHIGFCRFTPAEFC